MKYREEWKGKLRVDTHMNAYWHGKNIGRVIGIYSEGAKSPGGMVTNTIWFAANPEDTRRTLELLDSVKAGNESTFSSMDLALESLIAKAA
jgi:hypothetical protein